VFLSVHATLGIKTVLVALMAEKAEVRYDPAYIMPSQIANKVAGLGYPATVLEGELDGRSSVEMQVSADFMYLLKIYFILLMHR